MRGGAALRDIARGLVSILVFFAMAEIVVRVAYAIRNSKVEYVVLPYKAAQDFGPVPPWMDGVRILEPDPIMSWKTRANVHRRYLDVYSPVHVEEDRTRLLRSFIPKIPASLRDNPVWEVKTNSAGFREDELPTEKSPSAFRIICLGDSWTFGANVDQEAAYPERLRALIEQEFPDAGLELLNLGVLGYSSYQGLELLKRVVLDLEPDLLLIGFAMNDANVAGWRDKDWFGDQEEVPRKPISELIGEFLDKVECYRLLQYVALIIRYRSWSIGDYMQKLAASAGTPDEAWFGGIGNQSADYEVLEEYTRVSPPDYEENLREMIRLARSRDIGVILFFNELWDTAYRKSVRRVAEEERVQFIDSKILVDEARAAKEREVEERLDLVPPPATDPAALGDGVEVVFRVFAGDYPVSSAIYISGTHPDLGDTEPNRVAMYDDGTHGDQRAGDRVWSFTATVPPDSTIFYVYTNSGEAGKWEGLDIPEVRRLTVDAPDDGGRVYRPVETFGEMYMQADGWHTNAAGYQLMADAVLQELKKNEKVMEHLGQGPVEP
jgi:lysophospholipase L1-like esterase